MMTKKSNTLLCLLNIVMALIGIAIMFFASIFSLGSKEDIDALINTSYWSFFANRLFFNTILGIVFVVFIGVMNWLVQKITKSEMKIRRILTIDFLMFTICSIVFIATVWQ